MEAVAPGIPWPKRARRALRAGLILGIVRLYGLLPFGFAVALGRGFGRLAWGLLPRYRGLALRHLALAFPERSEAERARIGRDSFAHLGACVAEIAQERRVQRHLEQLVELPAPARQVLADALAEGRGALVITGHVGNWELLARRIAREFAGVHVVARPLNAPALTEAVDAYRARGRLVTLWRGRPGMMKDMLRVFRDNGLLGLLIDQDTRVQSVFVPFFGREASTPRAAGDLAVRTGAPLVAAFIRRRADGTHVINARRVTLPPGGEREADGVALTAAATLAIEEAIRAAPEQWVWMHERWKTRPEEEQP